MPVCRSAPRARVALRQLVDVIRGEAFPAEIIVVNDGSCPEVSRVVSQVQAEHRDIALRLLDQEQAGRSRTRNRGAQQAQGELLLFLDGDVLLQPGALAAHLRCHDQWTEALVRGRILRLPYLAAFEDPVEGTLTSRAKQSLGMREGAASPALSRRRLAVDKQGRPLPGMLKEARLSAFEEDIHRWLGTRFEKGPHRWIGCTGANLSISRERFHRLGGFDPAMGVRWGAEDMEFGYRAEKSGMQVVHAYDAVVCHMDHDSSGRDGDHEFALEYFAAKHQDRAPLKLQEYFDGSCRLEEVFA